jgi:hypothetical protein
MKNNVTQLPRQMNTPDLIEESENALLALGESLQEVESSTSTIDRSTLALKAENSLLRVGKLLEEIERRREGI